MKQRVIYDSIDIFWYSPSAFNEIMEEPMGQSRSLPLGSISHQAWHSLKVCGTAQRQLDRIFRAS